MILLIKIPLKKDLYCFFAQRFILFLHLQNQKNKGSMFTIGIFTTHIPYIALVVFYAFFFMFGYQNIAEEKISTEKKFTLNELTIKTNNQLNNISGSFSVDDFDISCVPKNERIFYVARITRFSIPPDNSFQSGNFAFSNFSRPPPAA